MLKIRDIVNVATVAGAAGAIVAAIGISAAVSSLYLANRVERLSEDLNQMYATKLIKFGDINLDGIITSDEKTAFDKGFLTANGLKTAGEA